MACVRFFNLLNNAKHAISNGGTLTISTDTNNYDSNFHPVPTIEIHFKSLKNILRIKFVDTGAGIEKDDLKKLNLFLQ